jgi:hypothetical protein
MVCKDRMNRTSRTTNDENENKAQGRIEMVLDERGKDYPRRCLVKGGVSYGVVRLILMRSVPPGRAEDEVLCVTLKTVEPNRNGGHSRRRKEIEKS